MTEGAQREQFETFAGYNRWMNERLFALLAELSDEERKRDLGAFFGSIHRTLNHILLADRIWLARFRRGVDGLASLRDAALVDSFGSLSDQLFESFDALRAARIETDEVLVRFTAEITQEALSDSIRYVNSAGVAREHPLWIAVAQVFNHQTHHRGQVTTLLSQLGKDPGVTDFLPYATM